MADMNEAAARIEAARRKKYIRRALVWGGIGLALVGVIYGAVTYERSSEAPGETYSDIGNQHIPQSAQPPVPYNSNPPTSGAHFATQANWGIYDYEANDRPFIHNLEHGGIWISYRPGIPASAVEELKGIVGEFRGSKIVMAPRSANDTDIAVAVWTHLYKFNLEGSALTEEQKNQIRAFYKAYKNRGPEFVPDSMPGIDPKTLQ